MIYYISVYMHIYRVCSFNFFSCELPVALFLAFVLFVRSKISSTERTIGRREIFPLEPDKFLTLLDI